MFVILLCSLVEICVDYDCVHVFHVCFACVSCLFLFVR